MTVRVKPDFDLPADHVIGSHADWAFGFQYNTFHRICTFIEIPSFICGKCSIASAIEAHYVEGGQLVIVILCDLIVRSNAFQESCMQLLKCFVVYNQVTHKYIAQEAWH